MSRPENQHYVSAAYLRAFLPDGERALYVRRRGQDTWFRQVPENIATRRNFYSILRKDGAWDDRLEHLLAEGIEAPGFRALGLLRTSRDTPSLTARYRIAILLAMQYLRVPQLRADIDRTLHEFLEGFAEHTFMDVEGTANDLQHLQGLDEEESKRLALEIRDTVRSGGIELKIRREASLGPMFDLLRDGAAVFHDYDWTVYLSDAPLFHTCDRPVYVSPSSVSGKAQVALVDPDVTIHCPLSSRRFLVMSNFGTRARQLRALRSVMPEGFIRMQRRLPPVVEYIEADSALVDKLNSETARSCEEWISGPSESPLIDAELAKPQLRMSLEVTRTVSGMRVSQKLLTKMGQLPVARR